MGGVDLLSTGSALTVRRGPVAEQLRLTGVPAGRWIFLSPHLDDAALSCGNLLLALTGAAETIVATAFTGSGPASTLSARAFVRQCGAGSAEQLYVARREEDALALESAGSQWVHGGLPEALFRRRAPRRGTGLLRRLVPELGHVYPTYRLHVASGQVSRRDEATVRAVEEFVERVRSSGPAVLVAPLGIGSHVDHVLVRDVAAGTGAAVVYYADVPYALRAAPDAAFLRRHHLVRVVVPAGAFPKRDLVERYGTQARALFPQGVPDLPDELYVPSASLVTEP
ncbi:PIG-L family deacetylase [Kineococcus sp. TBRC 1896]|uniref:PIG-L family deacetylase n=1 Tax=Kineococcus mangrovi TaxID=1660183 RepID=A0ABV4HXD0_9ACTN